MTAELTAKLAAIRAECLRAIELGEKATPGPWEHKPARLLSDGGVDCGILGFVKGDKKTIAEAFEIVGATHVAPAQTNGAFIAHARTFSPAAASAVLGLMDVLERCGSEHSEDCGSLEEVSCGCTCGADQFNAFIDGALQALADQWPEVKP